MGPAAAQYFQFQRISYLDISTENGLAFEPVYGAHAGHIFSDGSVLSFHL
jgi:hypothetical protein